MINKKRIIVLFITILLTLGSFSVGYGYWTDCLRMDGDVYVLFQMQIENDCIPATLPEATPPAIQLTLPAIPILQDEMILELPGTRSVEPTESSDQPATVVDTSEPVIDTLEPVIDTLEPVIDTPEPVIDTLEPVIDTPEPVIDTPEPVIDAPEPALDPSGPADDNVIPNNDGLDSDSTVHEAAESEITK